MKLPLLGSLALLILSGCNNSPAPQEADPDLVRAENEHTLRLELDRLLRRGMSFDEVLAALETEPWLPPIVSLWGPAFWDFESPRFPGLTVSCYFHTPGERNEELREWQLSKKGEPIVWYIEGK